MMSWRPLDLHALREEAIHVFRLDLLPRRAESSLDRFLDVCDGAHVARFRRDIDRRRSRAGRVAVRRILGSLMGVEPRRVQLSAGVHGKPEIQPTLESGLRFNVSHSGSIVLVALAWRREVGVDVEEHSPVDVPAIAGSVFSPGEQAALLALAPQKRLDAFFRGWVRKEAIIKAEGFGFTRPSNTFSVSLDNEAPRLLESRGLRAWWLTDLPVPGGQAAALASDGERADVQFWDANSLIVEDAP